MLNRILSRALEGMKAPADNTVWWEALAMIGFCFLVPFLGVIL